LNGWVERAASCVTHQGQEWLVSARGRSQLRAADTDEGRNIRRILKLSEPEAVPPEFLNALSEAPPIEIPKFSLLRAEDQLWAEVGDSIAEVSSSEAAMLTAAGAKIR